VLIAIGAAGSAAAATLSYAGTLRLRLEAIATNPILVSGGGTAQVTDDGSLHLLSFLLAGGTFGPITTSIPVTTQADASAVQLTLLGNLTGSFSGISGGPPGGGLMGLQGVLKLCHIFAPCDLLAAPLIPLTPTTGGAGFGIGGSYTDSSAGIDYTFQHAPWTLGQPTMTIHTPSSNVTSPALPGGFAHGPASSTSSTAQPSGVLQLVTVSKVFTSLTSALPELPVSGVLQVHFVPEPGTRVLLLAGAVPVAVLSWRRRQR
jgi:hypothetical protein